MERLRLFCYAALFSFLFCFCTGNTVLAPIVERSGSFIRKQAVNRDNLYASIFRVHQHSILFVVSIAALAVPFRRIVAWAISLGLAVQWGVVVWNKYGVQIPAKGSISLSYISFYFLGAYLGIHFHHIRPWLDSIGQACSVRYKLLTAAIWLSWLAFALLHVQIRSGIGRVQQEKRCIL